MTCVSELTKLFFQVSKHGRTLVAPFMYTYLQVFKLSLESLRLLDLSGRQIGLQHHTQEKIGYCNVGGQAGRRK